MRLIDADALKQKIAFRMWDVDDDCPHDEGTIRISEDWAIDALVDKQPTVDAVPVEFVMDNYNSEFVCDALTDDGNWCSEHCEFSEAQPECIHRYIERIWSAERKEDA